MGDCYFVRGGKSLLCCLVYLKLIKKTKQVGFPVTDACVFRTLSPGILFQEQELATS